MLFRACQNTILITLKNILLGKLQIMSNILPFSLINIKIINNISHILWQLTWKVE